MREKQHNKGRVTMTESTYKRLDLLQNAQDNADKIYKPTKFWSNQCNKLAADIRQEGIENFRQIQSCLGMFVPSYGFHDMKVNMGMYDKVVGTLTDFFLNSEKYGTYLMQYMSGEYQALSDYRVYRASDQDTKPYISNISESKIGNPENQFTFDGNNYSRSMLNYALGINFLKKHVDTSDIEVVMEVGGGFGTLGEVLLSDERNNAFYIDIDIAPTNFASSYYLEELLGEEHFGNFEKLKDAESLKIDELRKEYKATVLPSFEIERLEGEIDLFVNFISFQEMEPDVVENYLKHVIRLKPKYILLRNMSQGKNQRAVDTPVVSDHYDEFVGNYELVATNVRPFGYLTPDGFESEIRLYKHK